ncbi:MAG: ribonuclease Z [Deltaproteobacteria bacterium]|nr:ribonuclease Z [Deltaproteobacteria bacterium]
MSKREFIALGTQSQAPTKKRNHHGAFLRWDDVGILFDPGEGTQRQLAFANLNASAITHICITHFHGDHCLGLAGVVQRLNLDRAAHPIHVYYPGSGQRFFEKLRFASIFAENAVIHPHPVEREGVLLRTEGFTLTTRRLEHRVDCFGYRLQEHDGVSFDAALLEQAGVRGPRVADLERDGTLRVNGTTVRREDVSHPRPGQAFAFVMDTRPCRNAVELARGADLAVMESTFATAHEDEARQYAHCTAAQAARMAVEAGARRLALTHFSQRYDDVTPLLEEARAVHPDVVALMDLDTVEVPKRRRGGR